MLTTWCGSVPLTGGVLVGLFLAGAAGSPLHCAPMCGGFVIGQLADRMAHLPAAQLCEWRRVSAAALVPYHLGRLTTYCGLGAASGLLGAGLGRVPWLGFVSGVLLLLAASLFLAQGLRRLAPRVALLLPGFNPVPVGWSRAILRVSRRLDRSHPVSGYLFGVTLGFLPCGFLYAALATAAAGGNAAYGAIGMLAFGFGTIPVLVAIGLAGQAAGRGIGFGVTAVAPAVMLLNAALLAMLAVRSLAALA
jgi:sulfite exporter TauE/SafE